MKKLYLLLIAFMFGLSSFGQVQIMHETFGDGGFWQGAMNTNPNLVSPAMFSDDLARTQTWNASKGYDIASGGFHVILTSSVPTDTVKFGVNTLNFTNVTFSMGTFSWGSSYNQFAFEYSEDGVTWTAFDKDNLVTGDLNNSGWQFITFSEDLPSIENLLIKVYRTADQVHLDDIVVTGEPTVENAFLKSVSLDVGEIDFMYHTNGYEIFVPYGTTDTPVITAETFDPDATLSITDAVDITSSTEADRTSTITVTAEDGTKTNEYTILFNVTPPRTDANLSDIQLSYATLAPEFASDRTKYLVDLPDTATIAPDITPVLSDADGATFDLTMPVDITAADEASRTATIVVTAQDGVTTKTYEVVFKVGGGSTDLFLIDYETFGDEGNKFGIVLSNYPGFTSDFIWSDDTVNIRTSNPSTGYDLASGANRVEVQAGWGNGWDSLVFQANTSAFGSVTLATGIYNNSGADIGASTAFTAHYSTDSVNWTSIGNETQGGTTFPVSNAWSYVILDDVLPSDDTLYIMFSNTDANFEYYLDDISLWGTPLNTNNQLAGLEVGTGTLDPEFDPSVTSYVVELPQGTSETPTVTPTVLSPSATIDQVDAPDVRSPEVDDNTTTVTVTAEDGSTRTYEIVFDVFMSSDARLKELSTGDFPLSPAFSNDLMGYAVKLPAGTTEAPEITAVAEDDFAEVSVTPPVDINSSNVEDRTAYVEVVAEDQVTTKNFELVFTFGSLDDIRFNFMQEEFGMTGTFDAATYEGYTSDAMFAGGEHKFDNTNSDSYPLASGGAAIKFGEWGDSTYVELVMKKMISGYTNVMLSFGIEHNSGGWGDGGCGLTNDFTKVEYTLDSTTWVEMNIDSLREGSSDWPCGGAPFNFVELAEEIPVSDEGYVTVRISHTEANIHPFYVDDIVLSGSPISTDASLFDLITAEGSLDPLFDPLVYDYSVELDIGTTETPAVTATPAEENATVEVVDATDVTSDNASDRTTVITVTAPDGVTTETYTVEFNVKPNNDATLQDLTAEDYALDPDFSPVVFDYEVELPAGTTETPTVTAAPNDVNATFEIRDAIDVTSDVAASRTTTVVVTAEDGETKLTYSILFNRSTISVDPDKAGLFEIYPNPASDQLYIRNADRIAKVIVSNVAGEVLINKEIHTDRVNLNVSNLDAGYYIIRVETLEGETATSSFMKK